MFVYGPFMWWAQTIVSTIPDAKIYKQEVNNNSFELVNDCSVSHRFPFENSSFKYNYICSEFYFICFKYNMTFSLHNLTGFKHIFTYFIKVVNMYSSRWYVGMEDFHHQIV